MYKETLEALCEGLRGNILQKEAILKNQLDYCFKDLEEHNRGDTAPMVRRILSDFLISDIVGVQSINDDTTTILLNDKDTEIDINKHTKTRKFSTVLPEIDPEELKHKYGINLWSEITHAVACEVENEIISEIINEILKQSIPCGGYLTDKSNSEEIYDAVIKAAEQVNGNWVIASPLMVCVLQASGCFEGAEKTQTWLGGDLQLVGTLEDDIKLYLSNSIYSSKFLNNTILIGGKEEGNEDTGVVYMPHTMIKVGEQIEDENGKPITPLLTKYAMGYRKDIANNYRKITVDLSFE